MAGHVIFRRPVTQADSNHLQTMHGGKVLFEIDMAAAAAAQSHAGFACVTASVDHVSFHQSVKLDDILTVEATVTQVWNSSCEVEVIVTAAPWGGGPARHTTTAHLVMVGMRDGKPAKLPALELATNEQRAAAHAADQRSQMRRNRPR